MTKCIQTHERAPLDNGSIPAKDNCQEGEPFSNKLKPMIFRIEQFKNAKRVLLPAPTSTNNAKTRTHRGARFIIWTSGSAAYSAGVPLARLIGAQIRLFVR
jgi:hypothetical protein